MRAGWEFGAYSRCWYESGVRGTSLACKSLVKSRSGVRSAEGEIGEMLKRVKTGAQGCDARKARMHPPFKPESRPRY